MPITDELKELLTSAGLEKAAESADVEAAWAYVDEVSEVKTPLLDVSIRAAEVVARMFKEKELAHAVIVKIVSEALVDAVKPEAWEEAESAAWNEADTLTWHAAMEAGEDWVEQTAWNPADSPAWTASWEVAQKAVEPLMKGNVK